MNVKQKLSRLEVYLSQIVQHFADLLNILLSLIRLALEAANLLLQLQGDKYPGLLELLHRISKRLTSASELHLSFNKLGETYHLYLAEIIRENILEVALNVVLVPHLDQFIDQFLSLVGRAQSQGIRLGEIIVHFPIAIIYYLRL
jgi:hypothetical protein